MNLCTPRFSPREIAPEMAWPMSSHSKTCLLYKILSIRICDHGAQFLVNCFEKTVMKTNNSGFNSTYLLVTEERRERERGERQRTRINRGASEEDSRGKFMQHLRLV